MTKHHIHDEPVQGFCRWTTDFRACDDATARNSQAGITITDYIHPAEEGLLCTSSVVFGMCYST